MSHLIYYLRKEQAMGIGEPLSYVVVRLPVRHTVEVVHESQMYLSSFYFGFVTKGKCNGKLFLGKQVSETTGPVKLN